MALRSPVRHKPGILIIDNDRGHLDTLADILDSEGFAPLCCQTGDAALEVCAQHEVHVAILDLRLGAMDGLGLLRQLCQQQPSLKIIIHTGYASLDSAMAAVNQGAFAYVQKEGNVEELLAHIHRAFHTHLAGYSAALEHEVHRRTEALRESEAHYRSLVEGSIQGIIVHKNYTIQFANAAMCHIFGYPGPESLIGQDLRRLFLPRERARLESYLALTPQDPSVASIEAFQGRRHDGALLWCECLPSRVPWEGAVAALTTFVDITLQKRLEQEVLAISEREQQRLGQDLHDSLGQLLTGIAFMSKQLEQQLVAQVAPEAVLMTRITRLIQEAITQTRHLSRGFYPVSLESEGLAVALQELAGQAEAVLQITLNVTTAATLPQVPARDIHLYRIAQEAINNAVKHGGAQQIVLSLTGGPDDICLRIDDDGMGITDQAALGHGMGLRHMRYRARMLGARLEVHRLAAGGTRVACTLSAPAAAIQGVA